MKRLGLNFFLAIFLLIIAMPVPVIAADNYIGVANYKLILEKSNMYARMLQQLKYETDAAKVQLGKQLMSESDTAKRNMLIQQFDENTARRRAELIRPVYEQIKGAIVQVSRELGLERVENSDSGINGVDITDNVIAKLNKLDGRNVSVQTTPRRQISRNRLSDSATVNSDSDTKVGIANYNIIFEYYSKNVAQRRLNDVINAAKIEFGKQLMTVQDNATRQRLVLQFERENEKRRRDARQLMYNDVKNATSQVANELGLKRVENITAGVRGINVTDRIIAKLDTTLVKEKKDPNNPFVEHDKSATSSLQAQQINDDSKFNDDSITQQRAGRINGLILALDTTPTSINGNTQHHTRWCSPPVQPPLTTLELNSTVPILDMGLNSRTNAAKSQRNVTADADIAESAENDGTIEAVEVQFGAGNNRSEIERIVNKALRNGIKDAYVRRAISARNGRVFWRARVPALNFKHARSLCRRLSSLGFNNFIANAN